MARTLSNGVGVPNGDDNEHVVGPGERGWSTTVNSGSDPHESKTSCGCREPESESSRWYRDVLPTNTNLDNWYHPGQYVLSSTSVYRGTPPGHGPGSASILEVGKGSGNWGSQVIRQHGKTQYKAERQTQAGGWGPWEEESAASRHAHMRHQLRVDEFKRRRGGAIGLGGQGAIAFRFDHHYEAFMREIMPLARKHQIVCSMAMNGNTAPGTGVGAPGYDWANLQATHINDGLEIMSHSQSHAGAQGAAALQTEIVWVRDNFLATAMPQVLIEGWMQPGAHFGEMGSSIDSQEKLWGTLAGRMLMANYAVVSGHRDGYYRQLTGDVDAGLIHVTIESDATSTNAIRIIDKAAATRTGVVLMLHPNVVGEPGYMSPDALGEVFAHVAQLRDAGKIQNLTVGGMSLADAWASRREDLCANGAFAEGEEGWEVGNGWTLRDGRATSPTDTSLRTAISQTAYISRRAVIAGSPREIVVKARASGGAGILRVTVNDATGNTVLNTSRDLIFPASKFAEQRMFFTVPYVRGSLPSINLRWSIQQRGSRRVEIESVEIRSV